MTITKCSVNHLGLDTDTSLYAYAIKHELMFMGVDASEYKTVATLVKAIDEHVNNLWDIDPPKKGK